MHKKRIQLSCFISITMIILQVVFYLFKFFNNRMSLHINAAVLLKIHVVIHIAVILAFPVSLFLSIDGLLGEKRQLRLFLLAGFLAFSSLLLSILVFINR